MTKQVKNHPVASLTRWFNQNILLMLQKSSKHQLRLVVYHVYPTIISKVFFVSQVLGLGWNWTINVLSFHTFQQPTFASPSGANNQLLALVLLSDALQGPALHGNPFGLWRCRLVDGWNLHQLIWVGYPIIYKILYIHGGEYVLIWVDYWMMVGWNDSHRLSFDNHYLSNNLDGKWRPGIVWLSWFWWYRSRQRCGLYINICTKR